MGNNMYACVWIEHTCDYDFKWKKKKPRHVWLKIHNLFLDYSEKAEG